MMTINLLNAIIPKRMTLTIESVDISSEASDEPEDSGFYLSEPEEEEVSTENDEDMRFPRATPMLVVVFAVAKGERLMTGAFEGVSADGTVLIRVMIPPAPRRKEAEIGCFIVRPWKSVLVMRG